MTLGAVLLWLPSHPPHSHPSCPANQAQVEDLASWARIQPVCNQVELHPMLAQRRLVEGCRRLVRWRAGVAWHGVQCACCPGAVRQASLHG